MDTAPLPEGMDQPVVGADVLSAHSQTNGHLDWYTILHLKPPSSGEGHELSTMKWAYCRLTLHLSNNYSGYVQAFRVVCDSCSFLSNPDKKHLYDEVCATAGAATTANALTWHNTGGPP